MNKKHWSFLASLFLVTTLISGLICPCVFDKDDCIDEHCKCRLHHITTFKGSDEWD